MGPQPTGGKTYVEGVVEEVASRCQFAPVHVNGIAKRLKCVKRDSYGQNNVQGKPLASIPKKESNRIALS